MVKKGIARITQNDQNRFWANDLCTFEGIRWAHNTSLQIIRKLIDTAIATNRHLVLISMGTNTKDYFNLIPEKDTKSWFEWIKAYTKWIKPISISWVEQSKT